MKHKRIVESTKSQLIDIIYSAVEDRRGCIGMFYKNLGEVYTKQQTEEEYDTTPIVAIVHDPKSSAYGGIEGATV